MSNFEKYFKSKEKEFYDVMFNFYLVSKFVYQVLISNLGVQVCLSKAYPKLFEQDLILEFVVYTENILKKLIKFTQSKEISSHSVCKFTFK